MYGNAQQLRQHHIAKALAGLGAVRDPSATAARVMKQVLGPVVKTQALAPMTPAAETPAAPDPGRMMSREPTPTMAPPEPKTVEQTAGKSEGTMKVLRPDLAEAVKEAQAREAAASLVPVAPMTSSIPWGFLALLGVGGIIAYKLTR